MYRSLAPENLDFDGTSKVYVPSADFQPIFPHSPGRVLVALSEGFGDGVHGAGRALVPCEFPNVLSLPSVSVLAAITRAINRRKAVRLKYRSKSSGLSEREVVPLALVNIGTRWHARVFDRKSKDFRDFVLTRMLEPQVLEDSPVRDAETAQSDLQWSRIIELELVPHPDFESREVVLMDYPPSASRTPRPCDAVRPALHDRLLLRVEAHAFLAVGVHVAEQALLPAAESVPCHRDGDRHVHADHADFDATRNSRATPPSRVYRDTPLPNSWR
jgi:hypothetical protein